MILTINAKYNVIDYEFVRNIINISKKYHFNIIKTSGNVLIHLSDFLLTYSNMPDNLSGFIMDKNDEYSIAVYRADLKWDDDKIIPIYDKITMRKYKIEGIINKQKKEIIDHIRILNLLSF